MKCNLKFACQKERAGLYILPIMSNTGMLVPAKLFLSDYLFEQLEESIWEQIVNACSLEGVLEVVISADTHSGFGVPIGCVIASKTHVYPAASGYDISCGMALIETDLTIDKFVSKDSRRKFIKEFEDRVPTGIGNQRLPKQRSLSSSEIENLLLNGARELTSQNPRAFERLGLKVNSSYFELLLAESKKIDLLKHVTTKFGQLGSLGGGNHFCELQVDENGKIYVMLHTGSRGFGHTIATYFFRQNKQKGELITYPIDSLIGQQYWHWQNMAANFAIGNRVLIIDAIIEALNEVYPCTCNLVYEISHNLAQMEFDKIIHRKGATRAYPKSVGQHPIIIPGSMGSGAAVLYATEGAKESLYSINHGAGRVLGRNNAKKVFQQEDVNAFMNNIKQTFAGIEVESILTNTRNVPIDESIGCYKDLDEVLESVELSDLAKVEKRLYPIAVIKGDD